MTAATLPKPFRRLVGASALSNLSDGIGLAAFPLLAAAVTDRPILVAAVFVAGQAPWLILGLWAGALADRVDRRVLIQRANLARTLLLLVLATLIVVDRVPIWSVVVASFVFGVSEVLADTSMNALVPTLVPKELLEKANGNLVATQIVGNELAGPAIGGSLFALGAAIPFFNNAGLLAVSILFLAGVPISRRSDETGDHARTRPVRIRAGLEFLRTSEPLRLITGSTAALAAIDGAWFAILVLFVEAELGYGSAAFGVLLATGAAGGLAGAAFAGRSTTMRLTKLALVVFLVNAVALLSLAAFPNVGVTVAVMVATSAGFALWNVYMVSARHRASPETMLGRLGAAHRTVVVAASIVGALAGGGVADTSGTRWALALGGVAALVATPIVTAGFGALDRRGESFSRNGDQA